MESCHKLTLEDSHDRGHCRGSVGMTGSGPRMTQPPRPLTACTGPCMTLDAGTSRLKRLAARQQCRCRLQRAAAARRHRHDGGHDRVERRGADSPDLRGRDRLRRARSWHDRQHRLLAGVAPELLNGVYGGTKAFVLALSRSLRHELAGAGVRVQVVLPGATRTAIWARAGIEPASLPASMLMEVEEMVDAALVGLDRRELVTMPSLPDMADWQAYTAARLPLGPNLSRQHAAEH